MIVFIAAAKEHYGEFKEELVKKYEEQPKVEEHTEEVKDEAPKKKRGRKKKSE